MQDFLDAINEAAEEAPIDLRYPDPVEGLVLHVDGDYLAYYASGNDNTTPGEAKQRALELVETYRLRTGSTSVVMHLTDNASNKGERYLIATVKPYQGQRDSGRKPRNWAYLRDFLSHDQAAWRSKTWANREADDGIAVMALHAATVGRGPGYIAIATRDKDMRMLPGLHVDWMTKELVRVKPGEYDVVGSRNVLQYGLKWFFLQMLMGDGADFIPGLEKYQAFNKQGAVVYKQMGEATAIKMLEGTRSVQEAYNLVTELYLNYYTKHDSEGRVINPGEWADRFVEQAALLWMRTDLHATVADFANHSGPSRINHLFCKQMWDAVQRLEGRVQAARAKINQLGN